jgi:uncharacterized protein YeaO (DUF488 family)
VTYVLIGIKRIYDKAEVTDGTRVLVDRLWPRGVKKSTAHIDKWVKEVAPSDELRTWFGHDPEKWDEFRKKYLKELESNDAVVSLVSFVSRNDVTLIYAARDTEHNNAVVLSEFLAEKLKNAPSETEKKKE